MAKMENIEGAVDALYTELGREMVRYQLSLKEIERLESANLSSEHTSRKSENIKAKVEELQVGITTVVMSTKMKGTSYL